jgi:FKBP-type peptidyl-prolyl cis-trans isomerase
MRTSPLITFLFLLIAGLASVAQTPAAKIPVPSDVAAPPADAVKTKSGLATKVLNPGTGKIHPAKDEVVTIDFSAWTANGKMIDSSVVRGEPSTLPVKRMFPGLAEGIELMVVGETRRLWIPESLAYKGQQGKPAGMLVFDITLVGLPTRAPAEVKAPPADAMRTKSGLAYQVLKPGTGTHHPSKFDTVTVNYTGWTTDGKMFDSSLTRGAPSTFPLDHVIPGWTEGVQLMVEGEKMRFWIPENLAYQGRQSPYGMLVFDIELVKIQ